MLEPGEATMDRFARPHHRWSGAVHDPSGAALERSDPSTGEPCGEVAVGTAEEVRCAVAAARAATATWARTTAEDRAAALRRAADRLEERRDVVAHWNHVEMGRPVPSALEGVDAAVATIRQFAELGPLHRGRALQGDPAAVDQMRRVPRGVAACITPWNDPVAIAAQGVAANLAVGNCVVCKPSERASFSVACTMECFDHLPPGVLGVVFGDATTGRHLVDADVDVVVFTGSVSAGRSIRSACADRMVHTVLELGGNDPLVIDEDVDPMWAARQVALGCFANSGQICVAVERIYCHRCVAPQVLDEVARIAGGLRADVPSDDGIRLGPLVDRDHRTTVHQQVTAAVDAGATLLAGGTIPDGPGAFYPATVLCDVPEGAALLDDETFGPVAPFVVVDSFDEAIDRAASGAHGLAATVLTGDLGRALGAHAALPVGTVKVNSVFGGAPGGAAHPHGVSGDAAGYGPELLDELTRIRALHIEPMPASDRTVPPEPEPVAGRRTGVIG
ncbi:MAG: aldehyde dehydrogenase family protein [Actinomycetota bacterium]|nr:aldehyde dehydrogenase family protein [Actinomycetota bacterium]